MSPRYLTLIPATLLLFTTPPALAWKNGPPGNKITNRAAECGNPPYSTHDWIAEHGLALLPAAVRDWLTPHRVLLIIGTEAPDTTKINSFCSVPHGGYDDTGGGKHDLRFDDFGDVTRDLPATRAQEEYDKAVSAFRAGEGAAAAFYLGAAAHYIGDLSQYGHTISGEGHHADFELWVGAKTASFAGSGVYDKFIQPDGLEARSAYDAVIRTGTFTRFGPRPVIAPHDLDDQFGDTQYRAAAVVSVGHTLNKAVNETADMLYGFYQNVVKPMGSVEEKK